MPQTIDTHQLTTADQADVANRSENAELERSELGEPSLHTSEGQYTGPLLPQGFSTDMRTRWEAIQAAFVDDPRVSVQEADELVDMAVKKLAEGFADERAKLERQWLEGKDVSTEDLRQTLRHYRAFFQRLLSI